MNEKERQQALTRLWVKFKDGNKVHFYSRDRKSRKQKTDREVGIGRLKKMLFTTFRGKWEKAWFYENRPQTLPFMKYEDGKRVDL